MLLKSRINVEDMLHEYVSSSLYVTFCPIFTATTYQFNHTSLGSEYIRANAASAAHVILTGTSTSFACSR